MQVSHKDSKSGSHPKQLIGQQQTTTAQVQTYLGFWMHLGVLSANHSFSLKQLSAKLVVLLAEHQKFMPGYQVHQQEGWTCDFFCSIS